MCAACVRKHVVCVLNRSISFVVADKLVWQTILYAAIEEKLWLVTMKLIYLKITKITIVRRPLTTSNSLLAVKNVYISYL